MTKFLKLFIILILTSISCTIASTPISQPTPVTEEFVQPETPATEIFTLLPAMPTETFIPIPPTASPISTPTVVPFVESLKAQVTDRLTCRYGPGSEYLSLFGFNKGANIEIIGQTGGNNWVLVENKPQRCWVNTKFLQIEGDPKTLKVMYPDGFRLIVSPYYGPPAVLSATRDVNDPNKITVTWTDISLRAGDEEDESMFIYIIEVWRCEGGQIIFDPLASNYPEVTFIDEAGCSTPSHGRVFFQEKHGFAGPAEIPWPTRN